MSNKLDNLGKRIEKAVDRLNANQTRVAYLQAVRKRIMALPQSKQHKLLRANTIRLHCATGFSMNDITNIYRG